MKQYQLRLRPILMSDASTLLAWKNDEITRQYARRTHLVSLEEHLAWIRRRIPGRVFGEINRIAETVDEGIPVGYVYATFDPDDLKKVATIHYRVAPEWRGRGIASTMVPLFLETLETAVFKWEHMRFLCPIIKGNIASERLAKKLGLRPGLERPVGELDQRVIVDWVQD